MTRENCVKKSLNNIRISRYLALALFAFVLGVVLLVPASARAEAVYAVLRDTDPESFGGQVQSIWKQLLNVVNSFILVLMVMVAFAEILRLNISTYGIKKILPTLILAIIAANFSYMFCRLIIDIANVSMSFLHCISGTPEGTSCVGPVQTTNMKILGKTAQLAPIGDFSWTGGLTGVLNNSINNIVLFIEAILLLCLAFLFIVRNWVLYFLVIFSPLAIISVVLPSTKKYFAQWWDALVKWTFMPLVSFIFIALANRLSASLATMQSGFQGTLIIPIFVGVCLYYAITLPFKLGGPVMQSFYKNTGAKWAVNTGREKVQTKWVNPLVDEAKNRALVAYKSTGNVSAQDVKDARGLNKISTGARHLTGKLVRRGAYAEWRRAKYAEEVKEWDDQNTRESMGGRDDQFAEEAGRRRKFTKKNLLMTEAEMKKELNITRAGRLTSEEEASAKASHLKKLGGAGVTKDEASLLRLRQAQRQWGQWQRHIASLGGEKEWTEEFTKAEFRETTEGLAETRNSEQYTHRLEAAKLRNQGIQLIVTNEAYEGAGDPGNLYHANAYWSKQFAAHQVQENLVKEHLQRLADKQKNDANTNDRTNSENLLIVGKRYEEHIESKRELEVLIASLAASGKKDSEEARKATTQLERVNQNIVQLRGDWDKQMVGLREKYVNKDGQMKGRSAFLSKIVAGSDGQYHGDIDQAIEGGLFERVYGGAFTEQQKKTMFGRIEKSLSLRVKHEATVVGEKRNAPEAQTEFFENYDPEYVKSFLNGAWSAIPGDTLREMYGEYAVFDRISPSDPNGAAIRRRTAQNSAEIIRQNPIDQVETLAKNMATRVESGFNMALTSARYQGDIATEISKDSAGKSVLEKTAAGLGIVLPTEANKRGEVVKHILASRDADGNPSTQSQELLTHYRSAAQKVLANNLGIDDIEGMQDFTESAVYDTTLGALRLTIKKTVDDAAKSQFADFLETSDINQNKFDIRDQLGRDTIRGYAAAAAETSFTRKEPAKISSGNLPKVPKTA